MATNDAATTQPGTDTLLNGVLRAIDRLIELGENHAGLWPSIVDPATGDKPADMPDPIDGQRNGDRSFGGCNLMHDAPLLGTMYGLAEALGKAHYAEAADRYLKRFAMHCTNTPSGLFPWGEHAFWDLEHDAIGSSHQRENPGYPYIHDHLRQAPVWLWQKLQQWNPDAVRKYALGLQWHLKSGEPAEYSRHACIHAGSNEVFDHPAVDAEGRPRRLVGAKHSACDFPRHCGFYVLDTAFAASQNPDDSALWEMLDTWYNYWWRYADHPEHLLRMESRSTLTRDAARQAYAPAQTMSLGLSLMEASTLIAEFKPELAALMFERGRLWASAFFAAPHKPERGQWYCIWGGDDDEDESADRISSIWVSRYGYTTLSCLAIPCLGCYRLTGEERYLRAAESMGRSQLSVPMPDDVKVPAIDMGLAISMLADLYEQTGDRMWRDGALRLSHQAIERYLQNPLPVGAQGYAWYDSQMGSAYLLHGLARTALLAQDRDACPVWADYTTR